MSEQPTFEPPPPELMDCNEAVWTRLYLRPGYVAVALTAEQLEAVAEHERRKGSCVGPIYDWLAHEAATGESQRVIPPALISDRRPGAFRH